MAVGKTRLRHTTVTLLAVAVLLGGSVTTGHAHGGGHGGGHAGHGHGGGDGHHGTGRHGHGHGGGPWRGPLLAGTAGGFIGGWPVWYPLGDESPYIVPPPAYSPPMTEDFSPSPYMRQDLPLEYWYYCRSPQGYYPFVGECPDGWIQVLPQPGPPWPPP